MNDYCLHLLPRFLTHEDLLFETGNKFWHIKHVLITTFRHKLEDILFFFQKYVEIQIELFGIFRRVKRALRVQDNECLCLCRDTAE